MRSFEASLKLLRESSSTFEEQIFKGSEEVIRELYGFEVGPLIVDLQNSPVSEKLSMIPSDQTSELGQVISSIEQFAQKKSLPNFSAPNVDMTTVEQLLEIEQFFSPAEYMSNFSSRTNLNIETDKLSLICLISSSDPNHFTLDDFLRSEAGGLFLKMTEAFKLDKQSLGIILHGPSVHQIDFTKNYVGEARTELDMICSAILSLKPRFVVSFGGISTNFVRKRKENLSNVHGKFSSLKISYGVSAHTFEHFPLFHPSLLMANPSTKKVAWEDMKKLIAKI